MTHIQEENLQYIYMIIAIDAEKAFDKIKHPFMIKILGNLGTEGNFLYLIKNIYKNPTAGLPWWCSG